MVLGSFYVGFPSTCTFPKIVWNSLKIWGHIVFGYPFYHANTETFISRNFFFFSKLIEAWLCLSLTPFHCVFIFFFKQIDDSISETGERAHSERIGPIFSNTLPHNLGRHLFTMWQDSILLFFYVFILQLLLLPVFSHWNI